MKDPSSIQQSTRTIQPLTVRYISSAPTIFQRYMDTTLQGLKGVSTYIYDILVTDSTIEEHIQNLDKVLYKDFNLLGYTST